MTVSPPQDLPPPQSAAEAAASGQWTDIDLAAALAMMNHQPRYLARMVRAALATLPPSLAKAQQSLAAARASQVAADWAQLEGVAHQMKGALGALVAKPAANSAGALEAAARGGDAGAAANAFGLLETQTRAILPALENALRPGGLAWTGDAPP